MFKFGLIGEQLSHSHSPALHKRIMEQDGVSGTYELIEMPRENFEDSFKRLCQDGYDGLNVTIPYKELVLPCLDKLTPQAKYIGAVNTISFQDGKSIGHNTDYDGFRLMLEKMDIPVKGKNAVILGTGGASKAIIKALLDMGICDMTIVSRNRLQFHNQYTVSYEFFLENQVLADIIVNCTPVGMFPRSKQSPLPKSSIYAEVAIDLIYNPKETLFLTYAKELGLRTVNGQLMLEEQAKAAHEIWRPTMK